MDNDLYGSSIDKHELKNYRIGKIPLDTYFGLRINKEKLVRFARYVISGDSITWTAWKVGISQKSGKQFVELSGIPNARRDRMIKNAEWRKNRMDKKRGL